MESEKNQVECSTANAGAACQMWLKDVDDSHVSLPLIGQLAVQTAACLEEHGPDCTQLQTAGGVRIANRLWAFQHQEQTAKFTFTHSEIMKRSIVELLTQYGVLLALPEEEFKMWRRTGLGNTAPLVITVDGVRWRVLGTKDTTRASKEVDFEIPDDLQVAFKFYLQALRDGGDLKREVLEAVSRGEMNLRQHRIYIYKVFHVMGLPPTRSHDLTKTPLVNFLLGRCFHGDDLKLIQNGLPFEDAMALCMPLHMTVENHHPESHLEVSVLDMYIDRVARRIEKSVGWVQEAWAIPPRYVPESYREDFERLQREYGHLELKDPGKIDMPELLTAELSLSEEDIDC